MTNRDIVRYVLVLGMGSFAITSALTLIIKVIVEREREQAAYL